MRIIRPKNVKFLFNLATAGCAVFLLLMIMAMLVYHGGTFADHQARHYRFFENPFSDLGRTRSFDGVPNRVSMSLFILGMLGGTAGLAGFFTGFAMMPRASLLSRTLGKAGAVLGVIASLCFVGVAATPWDIYMGPHMSFVLWAFKSLLVATMIDLLALLADGKITPKLIIPFAVFIVALIGYIIILTAGLSGGPAGNAILQATAQKAIVFGAIVMVLVQSIQFRQLIP